MINDAISCTPTGKEQVLFALVGSSCNNAHCYLFNSQRAKNTELVVDCAHYEHCRIVHLHIHRAERAAFSCISYITRIVKTAEETREICYRERERETGRAAVGCNIREIQVPFVCALPARSSVPILLILYNIQ